MISKLVDLNCKDSGYFEIQHKNENTDGVSTDQELFTRWIRDLRSGRYTQLRESLFEPKDEVSFCALGVLCKKRIRRWRQKASVINNEADQELIIDDITEHVADYFTEITILTEQGYRFDIFNFLIELNDQCQLSFETIADIMELIHREIREEDNSELYNSLLQINSWNLLAV